jgi:hypothetical protein
MYIFHWSYMLQFLPKEFKQKYPKLKENHVSNRRYTYFQIFSENRMKTLNYMKSALLIKNKHYNLFSFVNFIFIVFL